MTMDATDYNVPVSHERCHLDDVIATTDLWENHAFLIRGRTADGQELTLFTGLYVIQQGDGSVYSFEGHVHQTTLLYGDYSPAQRQQMHDSPFATAGWQWVEHLPLGAVEVDEREDAVVWTESGRAYTDAPPIWRIVGEHGGVDLDLTLEADYPAFFAYPFEQLETDGVGWYEAYLRVRGRVTHRGRDMDFTGWACHERVLLTRDHEPDRLMGRGLYWQHLFDERVQCFTMASPSADDYLAHLVVDGEIAEASGAAEVVVEDVDFWIDPRSWMRIPTAWRVRVTTQLGVLDVVARAYARAFYLRNDIRSGTHMLYWFTADAHGTFTGADGELIELTGSPYAAHNNRAFIETVPTWTGA